MANKKLVDQQADEILEQAGFADASWKEPNDGLEDCTCDEIDDEEYLRDDVSPEDLLCTGCRSFSELLEREARTTGDEEGPV